MYACMYVCMYVYEVMYGYDHVYVCEENHIPCVQLTGNATLHTNNFVFIFHLAQ